MSKYADKLRFDDNDNAAVEAVNKSKQAVNASVIIHRRKIRRRYAKAVRDAERSGKSLKNSAMQTTKITQKAAAAVSKHPVVFGVLAALLLIIVLLTSTVTSCSSVVINAVSVIFSSAYLADDADINDAAVFYTELETDLRLTIDNVESGYPSYDEYNYNITGEIGHNPYELMAYLTAKHQNFWFIFVKNSIRELFDGQYAFELTETTEVYYDDDGEPYDWNVLTVNLSVKPLSEVTVEFLDESQLEVYDILLASRGNRQYVDSPFGFDWLPFVSSGYGWRISPITGAKEFHKGVDIAVPEGTAIIAAHNGVVDFAGWDDSYGNYVIITGSDGIATKYAHCAVLLAEDGQTVETGETIATVGSTGASTGSHLHFEVSRNGRELPPLFFALTK